MKTILLNTTNTKKLYEFQLFFSHYGIEVIQVNYFPDSIGEHYCFIKEETFLLDKKTLMPISNLKDLSSVFTYSKMLFSFDGKEFNLYTSDNIFGYIDLSKKINSEDIFGWDDVFISYTTGKSLYELSKINSKVIGRRENLSNFAKNFLYYENRLDLNFNQINKEETIILDDSVYKFVSSNKYLNSPSVLNSGFHNLISVSLFHGAFFRSSKNRREKNYWLPGLNAGIPLVAKSDEIHEITFAVHDFMHFLIPDILYNGENSVVNKQIYVLSRMMSEAITLVLADGWFVSNLSKDFEYDWSKRAIYPLFENLDLNDRDILSICLKKMINYVLTGDIESLYSICPNKEKVENFRNKYDAFFVEDYKWTLKNWDNMVSQSDDFKDWFYSIDNICGEDFLYVDLIAENIEKCNLSLTKSNIINYLSSLYIDYILDILDKNIKQSFNSNEAVIESFKHYMSGQLFIFSKYKFLNISSVYKNKIIDSLNKLTLFDINKIYDIRDYFNEYINELYNLKLIDSDDKEVYKEFYPLFSPYYAFYDKEKSYYSTIESYFSKL